jgi:hypothetical protein
LVQNRNEQQKKNCDAPLSSSLKGLTSSSNVPHVFTGNQFLPSSNYTYSTLKPGLRVFGEHCIKEVTFKDFVPPPPPMFESGVSSLLSFPSSTYETEENKKLARSKKQESCV